MRLLPKVIVLGMLLAWPMTAVGQFRTGNDLMQGWSDFKADKSTFDCSYFMGYVVGVYDTIKGMATYSKSAGTSSRFPFRKPDFPSGIAVGQTCRVVGKHLEEHPEKLHFEASVLVWGGFSQHFHPTTI